ncbi:hypothetical protein GIB67_016119 [Kingdonia uniflora]|uniref:Aminotransferase-like plant mobile domain-containing protein n=1 Tax=Kingdonia uniflora TaxID=39325 RepID=A0A7J7L223_9MAGN|nr:hypothetical protein GIB67_016119 [Kingdonia uniflora]
MVERWWPNTHTFHLPYGELGITPKDFTVLTGIGIGIGEPIIFEDFYTKYGKALTIFPAMEFKDYEKGCVSFAHLETYLDHTRVDFNDKGHLYYCLDQVSKQEVKYIGGIFQLIEYHCYEYCQIGHHILIDNRLDDFYPRMLAWQTTRRKFTGNKGIEVEWEDDEGEAGTSQAWTSNVRGSRGRTYEGGAALPRRSRRTR